MDFFARDRQFWRLLASAIIIGTAAALAALAFTKVVKAGTELIWPEEIDYGFLGGSAWWLGVTTIAGLIVGLARRKLRIPEQTAGAVAMMQERPW